MFFFTFIFLAILMLLDVVLSYVCISAGLEERNIFFDWILEKLSLAPAMAVNLLIKSLMLYGFYCINYIELNVVFIGMFLYVNIRNFFIYHKNKESF